MATLKCLAEDSSRDFAVIAGRLTFVTGADAVAQICADKIRTQLGEHQYAQQDGIDYFGNIFSANPNFQLFESRCRKMIRATPDVESISSFDYNMDYDSNTLSYTAEINTVYGSATISGDLING